MGGYSIRLTTKSVDLMHSRGQVTNGWIDFSIDKNRIFVYLSRDNNRIYWIGRKTGLSAKLSIKFNDSKKMITINTSNKIIFHHANDYEIIKKKTVYYKHMKSNENSVLFQNK